MNKCSSCPFYQTRSSYGFTTLRCHNAECEHYKEVDHYKEHKTDSGYIDYIPIYKHIGEQT